MAGVMRSLRKVGGVLFLIVLCAVLAVKQPEFLSVENVKDVLVQISGIAIAAVGMTLVVLTAGIDLSVAACWLSPGAQGRWPDSSSQRQRPARFGLPPRSVSSRRLPSARCADSRMAL